MSLRIFALSLLPAALLAQTAQVTGRITDQAGAIVPKAIVTVTNNSTGAIRKAISTSDGYYTVPLLQPGLYQVSVEMPGFKPIERRGLQLVVDQVLRLDFNLQLGSTSERIQVTAQAEVLESQTASLAQLVQGKQVLDLPLLGRDPYALAGLAPGVRTSVGMNDLPVDMISTGFGLDQRPARQSERISAGRRAEHGRVAEPADPLCQRRFRAGVQRADQRLQRGIRARRRRRLQRGHEVRHQRPALRRSSNSCAMTSSTPTTGSPIAAASAGRASASTSSAEPSAHPS